jgi:hypothetical protein
VRCRGKVTSGQRRQHRLRGSGFLRHDLAQAGACRPRRPPAAAALLHEASR